MLAAAITEGSAAGVVVAAAVALSSSGLLLAAGLDEEEAGAADFALPEEGWDAAADFGALLLDLDEAGALSLLLALSFFAAGFGATAAAVAARSAAPP